MIDLEKLNSIFVSADTEMCRQISEKTKRCIKDIYGFEIFEDPCLYNIGKHGFYAWRDLNGLGSLIILSYENGPWGNFTEEIKEKFNINAGVAEVGVSYTGDGILTHEEQMYILGKFRMKYNT